MPNATPTNKKVSELPVATTVAPTDVLLVVQGGVTKQVAHGTVLAAVTLTNLGGVAKTSNLSDLASPSTARVNLGLGNVENTADAAKPISTAQAAALASKADLVAGVIPTSQIPALALQNTFTVASQTAMLALTATQVQVGDIAVRTDGAGTFILTASDPTQLASWTRLNAPTDVVTTVNGQQGTVVLNAGNVGADPAGAAAAVTLTGLGGITPTAVDAKVSTVAGSAQAASYTLAATDVGTTVEINSAATSTIAVPTDAVASIPVGSWIDIARIGAGAVRIAPSVENLFPNPSAETNTTSYSARGGTLAQQAGVAGAYGTYALRATSTASAQGFGFFTSSQTLTNLGLRVGDTISARLDILGNSGGLATRLGIRVLAGNATLSDTYGTTVSTTGVTSITMTIPAGATALLPVLLATSTASGQTLDFDGLMLGRGAVPAAYADPTTLTGMQWLGTAHGSSSQAPVVRSKNYTIPQYGKVRLRKRAANDWTVDNFLPAEAVTTDTSLVVDRDNGQPGMLAPGSSLATLTTLALTSGTTYAARFVPSRSMVITLFAFQVTTASGTNDALDCGIYTSAGARVVSSGSTSGLLNSTGVKTVALGTVTLVAGTVYYAVLSTTSTATLRGVTSAASIFGTAMPAAESLTLAAQTLPLGSTLAGMTATDTVPLLAVRES